MGSIDGILMGLASGNLLAIEHGPFIVDFPIKDNDFP